MPMNATFGFMFMTKEGMPASNSRGAPCGFNPHQYRKLFCDDDDSNGSQQTVNRRFRKKLYKNSYTKKSEYHLVDPSHYPNTQRQTIGLKILRRVFPARKNQIPEHSLMQ